MNKPNYTPCTAADEMISLNLDDLTVEELELRLELASAMPMNLRTGDQGYCPNDSRG